MHFIARSHLCVAEAKRNELFSAKERRDAVMLDQGDIKQVIKFRMQLTLMKMLEQLILKLFPSQLGAMTVDLEH